jgi:hypothetical protein
MPAMSRVRIVLRHPFLQAAAGAILVTAAGAAALHVLIRS